MGPNDRKQKTRYQGIREEIEDNPMLSILLFVVTLFIGLGAIAGAYNNIREALPTRLPATPPVENGLTATAPVVNTQPPPSPTAAPAVNAPLDPDLAGQWSGQTSNGGTLSFTLKADRQAGGEMTLQADIPLVLGCDRPSDIFRERAAITFDPNLNRIQAQTGKVLLTGTPGGNPQNRTFSGQMTVYVKDSTGNPACTQIDVDWTAQKVR